MSSLYRVLCRRLPKIISARSSSTAAKITDQNTDVALQEDKRHEIAYESEDSVQIEEMVSDDPTVFHTRTLNVHPAFRRFRAPRESWIHSFSDHSKRGIAELHPVVFAANPRIDHIYEVIKWQDQCVREDEIEYTRNELPGSGAKMRPQKGTGKARMKDKRAPQFKFGGVPYGRRPRDHGYDLDLGILTSGFSAIMTAKLAQGDLYIVDSLQHFTIPSLVDFKSRVNTESVLFVTGYGEGLSSSQNTEICFHPGIDLLTSETIHPKAILQHLKLVLDYQALIQLENWVLTIGQEHRLIEVLETHDT